MITDGVWLMFGAGYFLSIFAKSDRVEQLIDLLPKVLPYTNSDGTTATAFQCLGKHGKHDTALQCFSILKKKGTCLQE